MVTKGGIDLNVCAYCNIPIDDYSRTVDHLHPKSRGGILSNKNKVPSCGDCNKLKDDMTVEEFHRAVKAMLYLEHNNHKKRTSYLKKVKMNTGNIIKTLENGEQQHLLRPDNARSRPGKTKEKKRP